MTEVFKVFVSCRTYNQSAYIKDALDGFCSQQTDFPFVCAVVDDASTDGEQEEIYHYFEEYFGLSNNDVVTCEETDDYVWTFAQHTENKNCYFAVVLLKYNHYSIRKNVDSYFERLEDRVKYIAPCEGDDYWVDPLKLQKQVDYMESHPDCSMCFGNAIEHWEDNSNPEKLFSHIEDRDYSGVELSDEWIVPTASVMFRKNILDSALYSSYTSNRKIVTGDLPLWLTCASMGKIHGFSDIFSVYRRVNSGFMLSMNAQRKLSLGDTRVEIYKLFGKAYRRTSIQVAMGHYQSAFFDARKERKPELVLKSLWKSIFIRMAFPDIAIPRFRAFLHKRMQRLFNSTRKS